jgi:hypothetical protein
MIHDGAEGDLFTADLDITSREGTVGTGPPTHGVSVRAARTHGAATQAVGPRHTRPHV